MAKTWANMTKQQLDRLAKKVGLQTWAVADNWYVGQLEKENKRLERLAHDLQKEIEFMALENRQAPELEDK